LSAPHLNQYWFVLSGVFGPAIIRRAGRDEMDNQLDIFSTGFTRAESAID
jgi:hypothetical protein